MRILTICFVSLVLLVSCKSTKTDESEVPRKKYSFEEKDYFYEKAVLENKAKILEDAFKYNHAFRFHIPDVDLDFCPLLNWLIAKKRWDVARVLIKYDFGERKEELDLMGNYPYKDWRTGEETTWPDVRPIHVAAHMGATDIFKDLLAKGIDVNSKAGERATEFLPIHFAAREGHLEIVKTCLSKGSDVDMEDAFDATPLNWASGRGQIKMVRFLLENGADVDHANKFGSRPLLTAMEHPDVVKVILEYKPTVEFVDKDGDSILTYYNRDFALDGINKSKQLILDYAKKTGQKIPEGKKADNAPKKK